MRTAGKSLSGILGPVLVVSVLAALVSLTLSELVVPQTNRPATGSTTRRSRTSTASR